LSVRALITVFQLTFEEARRRRILLAALICGAAFLALFSVGFHFVSREVMENREGLVKQRLLLNFFTLAGLYAANFLGVMVAVLVPVDTLSGEISSGVMQTLASKPVRRSEIVLGKWLACAVLVAGYQLFLAGGVLLATRSIGGVTPPGIIPGVSLMLFKALVLVTLSIAGGTRLTTIANGIVAFGLHGLAFIGGWVEQIGTLVGNDAARYVGTVASLIMPTEALWQLAAHHMQPSIMRDLQMTPFSPASVPSPAMVAWAVLHVVVVLAVALLAFRRRPL
jgi:ABC-type transport system involved in multi-copper enzyme maturation permease subunit